jgi:hypothetical protein
MMMGSVTTPRYKLTYSDYLLHFLPPNIERYVRVTFLNQQAVRFVLFALIPLLLLLLRLFTFEQMLYLWVTFLIVDALFGWVQWRIYQRPFWLRLLLAIVGGITGLAALGFLLGLGIRTQSQGTVYFAVMGAFVLLVALLFARTFTRNIDWQRVINYGEDMTWNPILIKIMLQQMHSSSPITRPWILPKSEGNKKRAKSLPYDLSRILQFYWWKYLPSKRQLIFRAFFSLLTVSGIVYRFELPLPDNVLFAIASVVLMLVGREILTERLGTIQFSVLPWPVDAYVKSFWRNTWWAVLPFCLIQVLVRMWHHESAVETLLLLIGEIPPFLWVYSTILRGVMQKLTGRTSVTLEQIFLLVIYVCAQLLLGLFPFMAIPFLLVAAYVLWKQRTVSHSARSLG